mmetsp:Transcript_16673/g.49031  ORF Transcript_16673/g.49031 Transcript_16673/m.49031 type:complete len:232 (-) Transcript_16673:395-1090(-)
MSLHGHPGMDMPFQHPLGYQADLASHQHMYPQFVMADYGVSNPPQSQADHYAMPAAMGILPHGIGMEPQAVIHPTQPTLHRKGKAPTAAAAAAAKMDKHLAPSDQKKDDRKEKNRQAAQRSRKRKQDHIEGLEVTVKRQVLEIESLRAELVVAAKKLQRLQHDHPRRAEELHADPAATAGGSIDGLVPVAGLASAVPAVVQGLAAAVQGETDAKDHEDASSDDGESPSPDP